MLYSVLKNSICETVLLFSYAKRTNDLCPYVFSLGILNIPDITKMRWKHLRLLNSVPVSEVLLDVLVDKYHSDFSLLESGAFYSGILKYQSRF